MLTGCEGLRFGLVALEDIDGELKRCQDFFAPAELPHLLDRLRDDCMTKQDVINLRMIGLDFLLSGQ